MSIYSKTNNKWVEEKRKLLWFEDIYLNEHKLRAFINNQGINCARKIEEETSLVVFPRLCRDRKERFFIAQIGPNKEVLCLDKHLSIKKVLEKTTKLTIKGKALVEHHPNEIVQLEFKF